MLQPYRVVFGFEAPVCSCSLLRCIAAVAPFCLKASSIRHHESLFRHNDCVRMSFRRKPQVERRRAELKPATFARVQASLVEVLVLRPVLGKSGNKPFVVSHCIRRD
jgi:hypothetical protein